MAHTLASHAHQGHSSAATCCHLLATYRRDPPRARNAQNLFAPRQPAQAVGANGWGSRLPDQGESSVSRRRVVDTTFVWLRRAAHGWVAGAAWERAGRPDVQLPMARRGPTP